jgi:hypothetical protein
MISQKSLFICLLLKYGDLLNPCPFDWNPRTLRLSFCFKDPLAFLPHLYTRRCLRSNCVDLNISWVGDDTLYISMKLKIMLLWRDWLYWLFCISWFATRKQIWFPTINFFPHMQNLNVRSNVFYSTSTYTNVIIRILFHTIVYFSKAKLRTTSS